MDAVTARIVGSTLLQYIEEIFIPCIFPIVYSTNQTIGNSLYKIVVIKNYVAMLI